MLETKAAGRVGWNCLTSYGAAGVLAGVVRGVDGGALQGGGWLAGLVDALQCVSVGGGVGLIALFVYRLPLRLRVPLAVLCAFLLGALVLPDDVGHFSSRQGMMPQPVAYWGAIFFISQTVFIAALLGGWLHQRRKQLVGATLCVLAFVVNDRILLGDYRGIHFLAGVSGIVIAGSAFSGARVALGSATKATLVCGWLFCAGLGAVGGGSEVLSSTLSSQTGAAFHYFFPTIAKSVTEELAPDGRKSPWLASRRSVPPIEPSRSNPLPTHPVVLMISVDALRADVVNNGEHDELLPNLARLRNEGLVFVDARAPGTLTKISLSSLFLGTYFSQQYWSSMQNRNRSLAVFRDETVRFPEILSADQVSTVNFRPISWVRNGVMIRGMKEDVRIKYPRKKSYYAPSPPVFKKLLPRVKRMGQEPERAVFLFSHLADPHAPYDQGKKRKGRAFERYLSEVELVDRHLGKLLRLVESGPLSDRVLLILTADHGEAFGEHGAKTHGTNLYDEALRIPLIFWRPNMEAQRRNELVSMIDLGPTILDAFRLATPGHMMGQSLLPFLGGEIPRLSRPIFAETRLKRALVTQDRMKLIVDVRKNTRELYDLKTDPGELKNLAEDPDSLRAPLSFMSRFFEMHKRREYKGKPYKIPYVR